MTRTALQITNQKSQIKNRGSVLILVVTVLVLMLLIGLAYVQTARTDRLSTAGVENNIDQVVNAEVARLLQALKTKLVSTSGVFLDDLDAAGKSPSDAAYDAWTGRQPYDYPDVKVDPWLASTSVNSSTQWPHISMIVKGGFLNGNASPTLTDTTDTITAQAYNPATLWSASREADADDDGITDSKYTDSAVQWISGVRYVTAIRVIDLSALVNINTALAETNGSGAYDATINAPRWWYPSELDFAGFASSLGGSSTEMQALLKYRLGLASAAALPTPWNGSAESRYNFWTYGVRWDFQNATAPYKDYKSLSIGEELKLRYRNGLNNPDSKGTVLNTYMPGFIRENPGTAEADYAATTFGSGGNIAGYLANEPRHQMTTVSAEALYRWPLKLVPGALPTPQTVYVPVSADPANDPATGNLKKDINVLSVGDLITQIRQVIYSMTGIFNVPPGLNTTVNPTYGLTPDQYAAQLAASIKDYADTDNKLTGVAVGGTTYYGMETLPFISEVYRQRSYQGEWEQTDATNNLWTMYWKKQGNTGYAIEFRNPFNAEVDLANVSIRIGGSGETPVALNSFIRAAPLTAGEKVAIVYFNSGGGTGKSDVHALFGGTVNVEKNGSFITKFEENGDVLIELLAKDTGGTPVVYQRLTIKAIDDSTKQVVEGQAGVAGTAPNDPPAAPTPADYGTGYRQADNFGNGSGINVITVKESGFVGAVDSNPDSGNMPVKEADYKDDLDALGEDAKKGATINANLVDPTKNQFVIANDSEGKIRLIGDLALIAVIGPRSTGGVDTPIADVWAGYTDTSGQLGAAGFMLNFDDGQMLGVGDFAVPFATVLMNRFTTLGGVDTNGDGTISAVEQTVPGRININTATKEMLMRVLPIPDGSAGGAREKIIDAIIAYRDDVSTRAPNARTGLKGIASIGELMLPATGTGIVRDVLGATPSGDDYQLGGVIVDFTPGTAADGITNDREERAMVLRWLSQVCTTRSDVFAAYIYIRGYDNGTFDADHLAEVARVLVIFDRSGIVDKDGTPRVIGYVRYK